MNLADMAGHVCEKVRKTDSDSVAACKGFLKQRDRMLWDKHLWRDSIYEFTKTVGPTMTDQYPLGYGGVTLANVQLLAAAGYIFLPPLVGRVMGVRRSDGPLPVEQLENYFRSSSDAFAETGTPLQFALLPPVVWQALTEQEFYVVSTSDTDTSEVVVNYLDKYKGAITATVALTGQTRVRVGNTATVFSLTKPPTTGIVTLLDADETTVGAVLAADTQSQPYQRLRLVPAPTEDLTLRFLVKLRYVPLVGDYEEPRLRQAENVLIALAMGDMFVRSGQIGASDKFYAEGLALLTQLGNIEFHQQAQHVRLVPAMEPDPLRDRGYGTGKGYW